MEDDLNMLRGPAPSKWKPGIGIIKDRGRSRRNRNGVERGEGNHNRREREGRSIEEREKDAGEKVLGETIRLAMIRALIVSLLRSGRRGRNRRMT